MAVAWITRLQDSFEIHLYSQSVEDLDLSNIAEAMTSGNRVGDKRNARDHDR